MNIIKDFITGMFTVIKVIGEPKLYRYPYRTSAEALRGDWMHIGDDIRNVMGRLETEVNDGQ